MEPRKVLMGLHAARREYLGGGLRRRDLDPDPFRQFQKWFEEASAADLVEPTAMALATTGPDGQPAARMVLLKEVDTRGFVFFTNTESHKGRDLLHNRRAALLFYWDVLARQVRVEGAVEDVDHAQAEAYFRARPRGSQISAAVSQQSAVLTSRDDLEARAAELETRCAGGEVPVPQSWGGYRVLPETLEFWQGRPNRLHDRLRYRRADDGWRIERLAP